MLLRRCGARVSYGLGVALVVGSTLLASRATTLWHLYLCIGLACSLGLSAGPEGRLFRISGAAGAAGVRLDGCAEGLDREGGAPGRGVPLAQSLRFHRVITLL